MDDERPLRVVSQEQLEEWLDEENKMERRPVQVVPAPDELEAAVYRSSMEQAIAALERAETIAEIKTLHDQAKGIHAFAVLRKDGFLLQQSAAALRIKAEHKAGSLLFKIERKVGKRTDLDNGQTEYQRVLEEEHIGETQAIRWQKMAMINETVLQDYLAKMLTAGVEITTADVLRLTDAAPEKPEKKEKFPGKHLKVMLLDATEMDIEEQESLIWSAVYRAYLITKKKKMDPEIKAGKQIPGYWLAHICAEYLATNPIDEEGL